MRTFLLGIALGCSVAACAQGPVGPVNEPGFNTRAFAGRVSVPAPDQRRAAAPDGRAGLSPMADAAAMWRDLTAGSRADALQPGATRASRLVCPCWPSDGVEILYKL